MSWFRRHFGLDPVDVAIHGALTGLAMGFFATFARGIAAETLPLLIAGGSVAVFAVRRSFALRRLRAEPVGLTSGDMAASRLEELEERVGRLEAAEARVLELEERLDFAERLLARPPGEQPLEAGAGKEVHRG
jgi:hypothetical protein